MDDYGRRLLAARLAKGWTQARLAQELGMHRSSVSKYEGGATSITDEVRDALDRVLGVRVADVDPAPEVRRPWMRGHDVPEAEVQRRLEILASIERRESRPKDHGIAWSKVREWRTSKWYRDATRRS